MLTRTVYLRLRDSGDAPDASHQLERDGYAVLRGCLDDGEVQVLRDEITAVFDELPADVRNPGSSEEQRNEFRYEMLNRSAAVQRLLGDRRLLDVIEPLLGEDCHVIANTAWRNRANVDHEHGGGNWHMDAGPHVPRPADVPWDDRIPYPVFAIGVHVLLQDCPVECGPTEVIPGSHRSGQHVPFDRIRDDDLTWDGRGGELLTGEAGDVALFVSDVWHRRHPTSEGDAGRFFAQIHYGRRDLAQRIRPTSEVNHLSDDAIARAEEGSSRDRTVVGLHDVFFYDA